MAYLKGTIELTASSPFRHVNKDSWLMAIWNTSSQSTNTKHKALDGTTEEDIPKREITAPLFWM